MATGVKVSKAGNEVLTADLDKLGIDSAYTSTKVFEYGTGTETIGQGDTPTITIAHNLGYEPLAVAYMEQLPGTDRRYMLTDSDPVAKDSLWILEVDTTNIYIRKTGSQASEDGDYDYAYYIFYETL